MLGRLLTRLTDPFQFAAALEGLGLNADDLPGLTRECRMTGAGA